MSGKNYFVGWLRYLKRHWLATAILGPMIAYGVIKGGGDVIAYFITKSVIDRSDTGSKRQPSKSVETGTVKPRTQRDSYTRCLEERHAELTKARATVEAAKDRLAACITDYKRRHLFPSDADAQAHCDVFSRLALAHGAVAKSIEQRVCRRYGRN